MSFQDPDQRESWAKASEERRKRDAALAASQPSPLVPPQRSASPNAMSRGEVDSMREWLDSWGDGPNWSDASGATIPITKSALKRLLAAASDTAK